MLIQSSVTLVVKRLFGTGAAGRRVFECLWLLWWFFVFGFCVLVFKSRVVEAVWVKHTCKWKRKGTYQNPVFTPLRLLGGLFSLSLSFAHDLFCVCMMLCVFSAFFRLW